MTVPVIEDEERLWRVTDAFGRLLRYCQKLCIGDGRTLVKMIG